MFIIVEISLLFHAEFVGMFMICFHMPSFTGSLGIAIKLRTKCRLRTASMLFYYSLLKIVTKVAFFEDLLPYIVSAFEIKWYLCFSTSQVRS